MNPVIFRDFPHNTFVVKDGIAVHFPAAWCANYARLVGPERFLAALSESARHCRDAERERLKAKGLELAPDSVLRFFEGEYPAE